MSAELPFRDIACDQSLFVLIGDGTICSLQEGDDGDEDLELLEIPPPVAGSKITQFCVGDGVLVAVTESGCAFVRNVGDLESEWVTIFSPSAADERIKKAEIGPDCITFLSASGQFYIMSPQQPRPTVHPFFAKLQIRDVACTSTQIFVSTAMGLVYCMASDGSGDLESPVLVRGFQSLGGVKIHRLAAGLSTLCAVSDAGDLYTWDASQDASSTTAHPPSLAYLRGKKVKDIACGSQFTLVLTDDNSLFFFGVNVFPGLLPAPFDRTDSVGALVKDPVLIDADHFETDRILKISAAKVRDAAYILGMNESCTRVWQFGEDLLEPSVILSIENPTESYDSIFTQILAKSAEEEFEFEPPAVQPPVTGPIRVSAETLELLLNQSWSLVRVLRSPHFTLDQRRKCLDDFEKTLNFIDKKKVLAGGGGPSGGTTTPASKKRRLDEANPSTPLSSRVAQILKYKGPGGAQGPVSPMVKSIMMSPMKRGDAHKSAKKSKSIGSKLSHLIKKF